MLAILTLLFLKDYWSTNQSVTESTWYLAIGNSTASIIVAALAPFLGAVADQGSSRKRFLLVFACMGIIGTGALWQVAQGNWQMAIFMYIIASVGFMSGNVFYDSLLPSVSTKENVDSVSALAYGLGYIGGGLLFLINVLMVMKPEIFGLINASEAIKLSFLMVAIWWAVFSIPIFLFVEEPKNDKVKQKTNFIILGWRQLMSTFKEIKKLKVAVIGSGIAGCTVSYFLSKQGIEVDLYEQEEDICSGASSHELLVTYPRLSAHDTPYGRFNLHAYVFATNFYESLQTSAWQQTGVLVLNHDSDSNKKQDSLIQSRNDNTIFEALDSKEASQVAGIEITTPAMLYRDAGYILPKQICAELIEHPKINLQLLASTVNQEMYYLRR